MADADGFDFIFPLDNLNCDQICLLFPNVCIDDLLFQVLLCFCSDNQLEARCERNVWCTCIVHTYIHIGEYDQCIRRSEEPSYV